MRLSSRSRGQVDDETIEALLQRIATALAGGHARIVVDLTAVTGLSFRA